MLARRDRAEVRGENGGWLVGWGGLFAVGSSSCHQLPVTTIAETHLNPLTSVRGLALAVGQ